MLILLRSGILGRLRFSLETILAFGAAAFRLFGQDYDFTGPRFARIADPVVTQAPVDLIRVEIRLSIRGPAKPNKVVEPFRGKIFWRRGRRDVGKMAADRRGACADVADCILRLDAVPERLFSKRRPQARIAVRCDDECLARCRGKDQSPDLDSGRGSRVLGLVAEQAITSERRGLAVAFNVMLDDIPLNLQPALGIDGGDGHAGRCRGWRRIPRSCRHVGRAHGAGLAEQIETLRSDRSR